jgi:hypothetical protein
MSDDYMIKLIDNRKKNGTSAVLRCLAALCLVLLVALQSLAPSSASSFVRSSCKAMSGETFMFTPQEIAVVSARPMGLCDKLPDCCKNMHGYCPMMAAMLAARKSCLASAHALPSAKSSCLLIVKPCGYERTVAFAASTSFSVPQTDCAADIQRAAPVYSPQDALASAWSIRPPPMRNDSVFFGSLFLRAPPTKA